MRSQMPVRSGVAKGKVFLFISVLVVLTLIVVFGGFFLGMVGLFNIMGVVYDSTLSLFIFAFLIFLLGFFFELIGKFIKFSSKKLKPSSHTFFMWKVVLDMSITWLTIYTVDELVTSVEMLFWSEMVFALLLIVIDYVFDNKKVQLKKLA